MLPLFLRSNKFWICLAEIFLEESNYKKHPQQHFYDHNSSWEILNSLKKPILACIAHTALVQTAKKKKKIYEKIISKDQSAHRACEAFLELILTA